MIKYVCKYGCLFRTQEIRNQFGIIFFKRVVGMDRKSDKGFYPCKFYQNQRWHHFFSNIQENKRIQLTYGTKLPKNTFLNQSKNTPLRVIE